MIQNGDVEINIENSHRTYQLLRLSGSTSIYKPIHVRRDQAENMQVPYLQQTCRWYWKENCIMSSDYQHVHNGSNI